MKLVSFRLQIMVCLFGYQPKDMCRTFYFKVAIVQGPLILATRTSANVILPLASFFVVHFSFGPPFPLLSSSRSANDVFKTHTSVHIGIFSPFISLKFIPEKYSLQMNDTCISRRFAITASLCYRCFTIKCFCICGSRFKIKICIS